MGRTFMCKKCHQEWEEAARECKPLSERTPAILDEAHYCIHCGSYEIAAKKMGVTGTIGVVEEIVKAQAYLNKAMQLMEPMKEVIDNLKEMRGKLYEMFDELTTNGDWGQNVDVDTFYSITREDEIKTVINAATSHIEEWCKNDTLEKIN